MHASWGRVGRPLTIPVTGERHSVKILGAVELGRARFHYRREEVFNAASYLAFLEQLARSYRRRGAILIHDNASYHKDGQVWEWFGANRRWLEVHPLPSYSPELATGEKASSAAVDLRLLMRRYINSLDQADFMSELNQAFLGVANGGHYASVVALSHRHSTGELVFTNAGHPPPFWRHGPENTWIPLEESLPRAKGRLLSVPVGMMPSAEYAQTRVQWAIGDLLFLYTDGLTEAMNGLGEELGWRALLQVMRDGVPSRPTIRPSSYCGAQRRTDCGGSSPRRHSGLAPKLVCQSGSS
ncbi:MAG TPA: SpoIIE family protein phosphatase [Bryobacterales bacterium]|nr:SpoIIE family protein phosphatase [Bryobacterales bacterium]